MEMERPHRTANNSSSSSDLFVCFTSRFCSFSHREQPKLSSSSSLTRRRLRTSGSIKGGGSGGQSSPMLILTGSKKIRGGSYRNGFENHSEPSSPKVTCIGQVRVKTRKKQGGRCCTRRRRKNQKWVQLPSTICEGLRAFGADLNCFLPCGRRSPCSSSSVSERDGTGKRRGGSGNGSCGAVFARWVMALQEEEDEGEGEERRKMDMRVRDEEVVQGELEIKKMEEVVMMKEEDGDDGKEESERISVCIPPRNALLLMRCRSDPVRIAALAANNHYIWEESFVSNNQDDNDDDHSEEEENEEEEEGEEEDNDDENDEKKTQVCDEQVEGKLEQKEDDELFFKWVVLDEALKEENSDNEDYPNKKEEEGNELGCSESTRHEQEEKEDLEEEEGGKDDDDEIIVNWSLFESFYQVQSLESEEQKEEDVQEFEERSCESSEMQLQPPRDTELMIFVGEFEESETEHRASEAEEDQTIHAHMTCTANDHHTAAQEHSTTKSEEEDPEQEGEEVQKSSVLPDCLLSMLYESKLSMEISKETWVCGKDFIRGNSNNQVSTFNGSNDINDNKNRQADVMVNGPDKAPNIIITQHDQPPRTSFSNPTTAKASVPAPSMAALVMQKLMSAVAQEPFVLTRCKSEPPRPSARLVPEACSWKNQNLLLLRPSRRTGGPAPGAIGLLAQPKC